MEGTHCFSPSSNCNTGSLVLPVIEYGHTGGACSVTGGYVYRGSRYPGLQGMYLYGDFCSGVISGARRQPNGTVTIRALLSTGFQISTFGEDLNGEIYVASYNRGTLHRVTDTNPIVRRRAVRQ
jgi:hypothetical protein